ncbi:MAG: hypothetical protein NTZ05_06270, partial [Chloroflexi bacterium]|nr:hypothetical protein [Chloroflexota bacterium]
GEKTVTMLQAELAVEANVLSQQLAVLRAQNVVEGRKQGTSVFYRVSDSTMFVLLDAARAIFDNRLIILREMADDDRPRQDEQAPQAMEAPSAV